MINNESKNVINSPFFKKIKEFIFNIFAWKYTEAIISVFITIWISIIIAFKNDIDLAVFWLIISFVIIMYFALLVVGYFCMDIKERNLLMQIDNNIEKLVISKKVNDCYISIGTYLNKYISGNVYPQNLFESSDDVVTYESIVSVRCWWDCICNDLLALVRALKYKGDNFGVNIIAKCKKNDNYGYYMPVYSYSQKTGSNSSLINDFKNEADLDSDFYYLKFFKTNIFNTDIIKDEKEILKHFKEDKNNKRKYNQYIAIPIAYKKNIFGLIQIIAYNDSLILNPSIEIEELLKDINNYFYVYEKLALLTYIQNLSIR